ncbi:hypothetical protein ACR77J_10930 [Tissierella praeacuta]|uniref:hypothetical protein n=1 Tax=Tissierella praeacuta TaxID=43131 RepID=UPI003DA469C7
MKKKIIFFVIFMIAIIIGISYKWNNTVYNVKSNSKSYSFEDFMNNKVKVSGAVTIKGTLLNLMEDISKGYLIDGNSNAENIDNLNMYIIKYTGKGEPKFNLLTNNETIRIWGIFDGIDKATNLPIISVKDFEIEIDNRTKDNKNMIENIKSKAIFANYEQIIQGNINLLTSLYTEGYIVSIIDSNEMIISSNASNSNEEHFKILYIGDKKGDFKIDTNIKFWGVLNQIINEEDNLIPEIIAIDYEEL